MSGNEVAASTTGSSGWFSNEPVPSNNPGFAQQPPVSARGTAGDTQTVESLGTTDGFTATAQHGRRRVNASGAGYVASESAQAGPESRHIRRAADADWDADNDAVEAIPTLEAEIGEDGEAVGAAPKGYVVPGIAALSEIDRTSGTDAGAIAAGPRGEKGPGLLPGYRLPSVTEEGIDLSALQVVLSSSNHVIEEDEIWTFEGVMEEVEAEIRRLGEHFGDDDDDEENIEANRANIMAKLASTSHGVSASPMKTRSHHHDSVTGLGASTLQSSGGAPAGVPSTTGSGSGNSSSSSSADALPVFGGGNLGFGTPAKGRDRRL